jgi:hypothetical protein
MREPSQGGAIGKGLASTAEELLRLLLHKQDKANHPPIGDIARLAATGSAFCGYGEAGIW